jgi:hypothetical protein
MTRTDDRGKPALWCNGHTRAGQGHSDIHQNPTEIKLDRMELDIALICQEIRNADDL